MAKRFSDTNIWEKEWFMNLSLKHKCLVRYLFDKCDAAGIWEPNYSLASFYIGSKISEIDIKQLPITLHILPNGKIFIGKFIQFQYGNLSEHCKPHLSIIKILKDNNIYEEVIKGYPYPMDTLKEQEQEKVKEQEEDKVKRLHLFIESEFFPFLIFEAQFTGTDYENCDLKYYHESIVTWSAQGKKKIDWIATAKNWMLRDKKDGKLQLKNGITLNNNNNGKERKVAGSQSASNIETLLINARIKDGQADNTGADE